MYDKLTAKVNNIDTSDYVLKANFNTKFTGLENKIPDTTSFVKKTTYNTKIAELENKIPSINNLATKAALTTVEKKIPSITGLVKKRDYNTKITDITAIKTKHFLDDNDLSYYRGKQNYLVFLPMRKYFTLNSVANTVDHVLSWQS